MNDLQPTKPQTDLATLDDLQQATLTYINKSKADNTKNAYQNDWNQFAAWCEHHGLQPLPAEPRTVALYLTHEAQSGRKASTIQRRISSISQAHQAKGYDSPTLNALVRSTWAGIKNTHGTAQEGKKPLLIEHVRAIAEALPDSLLGVRDRALLLTDFAGAFRRSELVNIDMKDVEFTTDGVVISLRRSKTDQEGSGERIGIPYGSTPLTCPVRALRAWLDQAGITEGAVFRSVNRHGQVQAKGLSDKAVALIVKRAVELIGLNPDEYSGHSTRSGLATSAAKAGVSERVIMKQTRHKSTQTVRKYIKEGELFAENAAARVGL
ncbi:site-specific integrase [Tumebacillus flagellatus]|uniref:Integrase n=1 Tax=Tumebacillus flagellatus TaxID=1157490 RepID=A0A074LL30_9BACL|nr:site-specific integrase [Tumebacillus flagellatus]KEO81260.1 integrase [Tumebacillus flagellatus]